MCDEKHLYHDRFRPCQNWSDSDDEPSTSSINIISALVQLAIATEQRQYNFKLF